MTAWPRPCATTGCGKHAVSGMASMVFAMLENGWGDAELGLEADELLRLKHVTGFSKLFEDVEYRRACETRQQIRLRVEHNRVKNAARRGAGRRSSKRREDDLMAQYQAKAVSPPTPKQIAQRQAELEKHCRRVAQRANANLVGRTCPECGKDFYVERDVAQPSTAGATNGG